jgi:hypothetical protein
MCSDASRLPLVLVAFIGGLALVLAGFLIAAEMRSATASPAAAVTGSGCYTNWNGNTCSAGYTAVETGVWTTVDVVLNVGQMGSGVVCAGPKTIDDGTDFLIFSDTSNGADSHHVENEPCATCCAVVISAVGGIGELPPMAGIGGSPSYNYAIAALLAFVAVVAFAAGGWYARRRWLG